MENFRKHGLVHVSQLSKQSVLAAEIPEIVAVGDVVFVKVIGISEEGKVSLSMKYANQTSGEDLDGNQVDLMVQGQRKRTSVQELKPLTLGAILDTVCLRCGGKGHLAKECYATDSGQNKYELLPDTDEVQQPPPPPQELKKDRKEKRHKKHKKEKKAKKQKH